MSWLKIGGAVGNSVCKHDLFLVLDVEETCVNYGPCDPAEIIELSAVAIDAVTGETKSELQMFVCPQLNPVLDQYCIETTGVTQENVDDGATWKQTVRTVHEWLESMNCVSGEVSFAWVTMGDRDLGTIIPKQCELVNMSVPHFWHNWIDLKQVFQQGYRVKGASLMDMLTELGLPLIGLQHSGIDACRNVGAVVKRAIWDGKNVDLTSGYL